MRKVQKVRKVQQRGAKRFEDLRFWQEARELHKAVLLTTRKQSFRRNIDLSGQLRRSALSVMANIAEGFGRGSNNELAQFLFIAKGSLSETQSHLYAALDAEYLTEAEFRNLYEHGERIAFLINSFLRGLNRRKGRQPKDRLRPLSVLSEPSAPSEPSEP